MWTVSRGRENLSVCRGNLGVCKGNLGVPRVNLGVCKENTGVCRGHLGVFIGNLDVYRGNLGVCRTSLGVHREGRHQSYGCVGRGWLGCRESQVYSSGVPTKHETSNLSLVRLTYLHKKSFFVSMTFRPLRA